MAKKPNKSDSHEPNVVKIEELSEKFQSDSLKSLSIELEKKCLALGQSLDLALKELEKKQEEINHLQDLLSSRVPIIGQLLVNVSEEEELIELQIKKIKDRARFAELTLDDTRKLDLLIKNKRQLKEDNSNKPEPMSTQLPSATNELLRIANLVDVTPNKLNE